MYRRDFLKATATGALVPLIVSPGTARHQEKNPKFLDFRSRIKPITAEERSQRIANAQRLMADRFLEGILFEPGTSLEYFTGVKWGRSERLFAMILPRSGDPVYIAPKFEETRAAEEIGTPKLYTWQEHENPYLIVKRMLEDLKISTETLGVEETTRQFVTDGITQAIQTITLASATPVTAGCRSVKSDHELELMQIANEITREVYLAAVPQLRDGMMENEFAEIITKSFAEYGVRGGALVLFGDASALPHGTQKHQKLRENQIVLIDGGCAVEGYQSDVTRTTVFGKPTEKMQKVFSIVKKAQAAALANARPGAPAELLDASARKVVVDNGFAPNYKYFTHRLGHGIGMDGHEWYYLVLASKRPVQANNTFTDEPGIYIPGEFGIRCEDSMVIAPHGSKFLLPPAESLEKIFSI